MNTIIEEEEFLTLSVLPAMSAAVVGNKNSSSNNNNFSLRPTNAFGEIVDHSRDPNVSVITK